LIVVVASEISTRDEQLLASPDGQATLARIDDAVGEFFAAGVDRDKHVRQITLICLNGRNQNKRPAPTAPTSPEIEAVRARQEQ
jgi:hypothetical protein